MNRYLIVLILVVTSLTVHSQDTYNVVADNICECLDSIDFDLKETIFKEYEECTNTTILKYESQLVESEGIDFTSSGSVENMIARLTNLVMSRCPDSFARIMEVIGNTTRNQTIEGRILSIHEKRFLEVNVQPNSSKDAKLIILNYFPEAKQKLEYILANQDKRYKFEFRKISILDLDTNRFENYQEITKIVLLD